MKSVLDVSAAFEVITQSKFSQKFVDQLQRAEYILAPELYFSEATNTAWKYHRFTGIDETISLMMAKNAIQLVGAFFPLHSLWLDAFQIACKYSHPAYDCFYLALAQQENASLMSLDKRMISLAKELNIPII